MNWIVMPYLDNIDQTIEAVGDCLKQRVPELRILLIDNGSTDPRARLPEFKQPNIMRWHYAPPMLSLASVWNAALRFLWGTGAKHALVVNNDVRLPVGLYQGLADAMLQTDAWFVTASNVRDAWYPGMLQQSTLVTEEFLQSRGGPDFSCYLISQTCHRWFQFDEGFQPAYFEDNDYHRRLQLAGFGDKIFSVNIPYLHYGSGTLTHATHLQATWHARFAACQEYYVRKWGGLPHQETYPLPFNQQGAELNNVDPRVLMTGQGKPGGYYDGPASSENWPWQGLTT